MREEPFHVLNPQKAAELYWQEIIMPNFPDFINAIEGAGGSVQLKTVQAIWIRGFMDALSAVERKVIVPISNN